jgi:uncharacterized protein YaaQ
VKLVVAIVHNDDAGACTTALNDGGFEVTRLNTSGGFLQKGNATLLVGVGDEHVDDVIDIVRQKARDRSEYLSPIPPMAEPAEFFVPFPVEVQVGGATVFVLDVPRFERL